MEDKRFTIKDSLTGELIFAPDALGTSDVYKAAEIAAILKDLLENLEIVTKPAEIDLSGYNVYSKQEVDDKLGLYTKTGDVNPAIDMAIKASLADLWAGGSIYGPESAAIAIINANINSLQDSVSNLGLRVANLESGHASNSEALTQIRNSVGILSNLLTNNKNSLVAAINELVEAIND